MATTVREITQYLETWAPRELAESWDNVGLLCGHPDREVRHVLTALDVTAENVAYAVNNGVDLIVAHHPLIFKPLKTLAGGTPLTDLLATLQRYDIAVYAAHTNLDIAAGGVNDRLAELLGLTEVKGLVHTGTEAAYKLVVFTPATHADAVRAALGDSGAGYIGKYSHCSFSATGTGRFLPHDGARPYLGTIGAPETVREERIETIVPEALLEATIRAMLAAHPYEEVAYDVYPLQAPAATHWLGRVGKLPEALPLPEALRHIREVLGIPVLRSAGHCESVRTIALCGGSGMEFWPQALQSGADLYLTGDVRYHDAQSAAAAGLVVADGHHYYTEAPIADVLAQRLAARNPDLTCTADPTRKDIFEFTSC